MPNRSVLLERLRRAIRCRKRGEEGLFAVLFLDLDRFKAVNDSLGHEAGDALLVAIAERLRRHLRSSDSLLAAGATRTAARHGGDEFVVLLEGLRQPADVAAVASRLLDALSEPYQIGAYRVASSASMRAHCARRAMITLTRRFSSSSSASTARPASTAGWPRL